MLLAAILINGYGNPSVEAIVNVQNSETFSFTTDINHTAAAKVDPAG